MLVIWTCNIKTKGREGNWDSATVLQQKWNLDGGLPVQICSKENDLHRFNYPCVFGSFGTSGTESRAPFVSWSCKVRASTLDNEQRISCDFNQGIWGIYVHTTFLKSQSHAFPFRLMFYHLLCSLLQIQGPRANWRHDTKRQEAVARQPYTWRKSTILCSWNHPWWSVSICFL